MTFSYIPPPYDCPLCPRLAAFRETNRLVFPSYFNGPVPSFGKLDAELLVVGLAPGLKGANNTGRPFTGDYAGIILYSSLQKFGFAKGSYNPEMVAQSNLGTVICAKNQNDTIMNYGDAFNLVNCRITNSVRCVPPQNKPEPSEIRNCNSFLKQEIGTMPRLKVILTLGQIAHKSVIMALGGKQSAFIFKHGASHSLMNGKYLLFNSYHCSRYNINTRVLTQHMFDDVVGAVTSVLNS